MASEKNNFVGDKFLEVLYVLDSNYVTKFVIDTFSDFLWTERYYGYGEFEITMPVSMEVIQNCRLKDYVSIKESNVLMIVETIAVHTDPEMGDTLTISGRSLESLLERRIVLDEVVGSKTIVASATEWEDPVETLDDVGVQEAISIMLTNNLANPSDYRRQIPKFSFLPSSDPRIVSLIMTSFEERGVNVYDKISSICKDNELGFRVIASGSGGYLFQLYYGTDRSWDQNGVNPVVFSESYENLNNSDYLQTERDYKSTVYVEWDWRLTTEKTEKSVDPTTGQITETVSRNNYNGTELSEVYRSLDKVGLDRRESYTMAGQFDFGTCSIDKYNKGMLQEVIDNTGKQVVDIGKEYLADYRVTKLFEGETNAYRQFVYGVDYILGDIVQLENKYGKSGKCRITEIVYSRDTSGPRMTPTFEGISEAIED